MYAVDMARKNSTDIMRHIANRNIYGFYRDRLRSIALAQFEWRGLPATMNRRYLETQLLSTGSALVAQPRGIDEWVNGHWLHKGGRFNMYGEPTDVWLHDYNGRQIEVDDFYIIYDNESRSPLMHYIDLYAALLWETHQTFRSNLRHQRTPYVVMADKNEELSVKALFADLDQFSPVVRLTDSKSGKPLSERVNALRTEVHYIGNDLLDTRTALWKDAINMLGIASETTKRERLIRDEMVANRAEDQVTLNSRLMSRLEFCNRINDEHGLNITVNLSSQPTPQLPTLYTETDNDTETEEF